MAGTLQKEFFGKALKERVSGIQVLPLSRALHMLWPTCRRSRGLMYDITALMNCLPAEWVQAAHDFGGQKGCEDGEADYQAGSLHYQVADIEGNNRCKEGNFGASQDDQVGRLRF